MGIIIGKYSYGNPIIVNYSLNYTVNIGNFCSVGANTKIYTCNGIGHDCKFISTYPFGIIYNDIFSVNNNSNNKNIDVNIGNDVWIGENVVIMSGVNIGDGCVIANNSHVVSNVEPYSIIGGNPAKIIKKRFTNEQIDKLLHIKWWDWDDNKINENIRLICSLDIDNFIELHS